MENKETMAIFESKHIRRYFDSVNEVWYFSLVDIVAALTDSTNATDYLKKIRKRDEELNFYIGTNCPQVDMQTESGLDENAKAGKKGGKIAKDARLALELKTGKKVVTGDNFLPPAKENKKLK